MQDSRLFIDQHLLMKVHRINTALQWGVWRERALAKPTSTVSDSDLRRPSVENLWRGDRITNGEPLEAGAFSRREYRSFTHIPVSRPSMRNVVRLHRCDTIQDHRQREQYAKLISERRDRIDYRTGAEECW